jgi:hypothetical protein
MNRFAVRIAIASMVVATAAASMSWQMLRRHSISPAHPSGHERERISKDADAPTETPFWEWRLSYPTGRYSSRWYQDARAQHDLMEKSLPGPAFSPPSYSTHSLASAGAAEHRTLDPTHVTALGPSPLQEAPYGLVGGRVTALVAHPTQANIAWFGSDGGGVWKTVNCCDANTTWQPKTDAPDIANIAIGALTLDPANPDVIYAGTGDFRRNRPFTFGAGGLLKSGDGGETWTVLGASVFNPVYTEPAGQFPQYRAMSAVVVDPNNSARLAVGTNQGLYFSHDSGVNWDGPCYTNAFSTQRQDISSLIAIDNGTTTDLIAAVGAIGVRSDVRYDLRENGADGIYRTGMPASGCPAAWTLISRPDNGWPVGTGSGIPRYQTNGNPLGRLDLAAAPSNQNVLYVQAMYMGVWRSLDGGSTWTNSAVPPNDFATGCVNDSYNNGVLFEDYNAGLLVSPTDPNTLFLSSTDVWRSTDGADTFTDLTCGYDEIVAGQPGNVHVDNHMRAFVANDPNHLLVGNDGGIYYSANALATRPQFDAMNNGTNTIEFYSGDITAHFNDAATTVRGIVGGAQDNNGSNYVWSGGSPPGLAIWNARLGGDGTYSKIEPILAQRWYYSSQFGYLMASTSGPDTVPDQMVAPYDESTFEVWQGDRTGFLMDYDLYKFGGADTCPSATGCQRMVAGTYRVWESLSGGLPNTSWYINSADLTKALAVGTALSIINHVEYAYSDPAKAVVATNDGNVWFGFGLGGGTAGSASWVNLTGGNAVLPNRPVMDVTTDPASATIAYAALAGFDQNTPATPGHVYRVTCSADCATYAWTNKSGNLPNIPVNTILLNPNVPGQAFVGTDWGLYYTDNIAAPTPVWNRFDAGLPSAMIWDLVIDRGATTLAIFTRSRGAYVWPLPQGDVIFRNGFD